MLTTIQMLVQEDLINTRKFKLVEIPFVGVEESDSVYYDNTFLEYSIESVNKDVFSDKSLPWWKRYLDLLPIKNSESVKSIGEGNTPLITSKKYKNCFFKDEARNPSGSFKDRESALAFAYFSELNAKKFIIASCGNAALSASLYASVYGAEVLCFIPENASPARKSLINAYGGKLFVSGDSYEDCYRALFDNAKNYEGYFNITAGVCPIRDQASKIISYEIFDEIGEVDYVIAPAGNGALLFGMYMGFKELLALGLIKKIPVFVAVQIEGSSPLESALKLGKSFEVLNSLKDSLAEGIVATESYCAPKAIDALKKTSGFVCTVTDESLLDAMKYAIRTEGLFPEWTSVTAFAALQNLYKNGTLNESSKVVVVSSGSGLKEISSVVDKLKY